jgi:hypothetical protein
MYAMEFTRKNFLIISSEDTKYDSDVFLLDLKLENNLLAQRKWQDDFDSAYWNFLQTATNLFVAFQYFTSSRLGISI